MLQWPRNYARCLRSITGRCGGALRAEGLPFRVQMMQSKTVSNGELIAVSPGRGQTWKAEPRLSSR